MCGYMPVIVQCQNSQAKESSKLLGSGSRTVSGTDVAVGSQVSRSLPSFRLPLLMAFGAVLLVTYSLFFGAKKHEVS